MIENPRTLEDLHTYIIFVTIFLFLGRGRMVMPNQCESKDFQWLNPHHMGPLLC